MHCCNMSELPVNIELERDTWVAGVLEALMPQENQCECVTHSTDVVVIVSRRWKSEQSPSPK